MSEKYIYHLDTDTRKNYYVNHVQSSTTDANDPIIIFDNGSFNGRAGWSNLEHPSLVFPNIVKKLKKNNTKQDVLIGNEIQFPTDFTKDILKTPFYNDIVLDFEVQENIMDYVFKNLSVKSCGYVDYPLLMTETFANPTISRKYMTELLFELYGIPSLCFGVDSLFAFNAICHRIHGKFLPNDAIIISLSHSAIHLIPRIDGIFQYKRAKRLNLGGQTIHRYLNDLIALSHPTESYQMFPDRINEVVHKFVQLTSFEYFETLNRIYQQSIRDTNSGIFLQLPVSNGFADMVNSINNQIIMATDDDKTVNDDNKKRNLKFYQQLHSHHNSNRLIKIESLQNEIATLEESIQDNDDDDETSKNSLITKLQKTQSQLDQIMLKYKKSEDFLNGDISLDELLSANSKNRLTTEEISKLQQERHELLEKKNKRIQQKKELSKRKGCALRNRIKYLTQLAGNEDDKNISSNGHSSSSRKRLIDEDLFGLNDEDWDIYRSNNNQHSDHDSEAENERIIQIENKLSKARQPIEQQIKKENTNIDDLYRIRLTTEPYRSAEILFRPFIAGLNKQNGLIESMELLLKQFTSSEQNLMCQNVYITGGLTNITNFSERIKAEIQCIRPFDSVSNIFTTYDSLRDSWDGACNWYKSLDCSFRKEYFTQRELYYEYGSGHPKLFQMHPFSNFYPS